VFAQEQLRPKTARFRERWKAYQNKIDPARLVFVDETWIKTNMTRVRGWSRRGTPLHAKVPHGNWKTLTFIAGLRFDRIDAPWVLDGPVNRESFDAWVETQLIPLLKPGDIVVLDNLSSHKSARARKAIKAAGAHLFFLPPYSPDLNPIEQVFAKLKTLIRKAEARTVDDLCEAAGRVLEMFSATECARYLRNAGYASI
jgi:transposase